MPGLNDMFGQGNVDLQALAQMGTMTPPGGAAIPNAGIEQPLPPITDAGGLMEILKQLGGGQIDPEMAALIQALVGKEQEARGFQPPAPNLGPGTWGEAQMQGQPQEDPKWWELEYLKSMVP